MAMLLVKYLASALVIAIVSEVAKKADRLGALISSLPLVTILIMIWLHVEKQGNTKIANHAFYTFWYVLPTMPMFLLLPSLLRRGMNFWLALLLACLMTFVLFICTHFIMKHFGVELM